MDVSFKTDDGRFNLRVGAVIIHQGKLLVTKNIAGGWYYLPGGRVMLGEDTQSALKREILEELHTDCEVVRPLWIHENFFYLENLDEKFHEICFYYLVDFENDLLLKHGENFEMDDSAGEILEYSFINLYDLPKINLQPEFLIEGVKKLPISVQVIQD